jgi:hypothetical protein
MRIRKNRIVEREAVNATRDFFEANGCIFQEVDSANDYGKDAYVDIVDEENVTGVCAALQIKGGTSYRRKNGYVIPVEGHFDVWSSSTVPIIGIVYDPNDKQLRWCHISRYLNNLGPETPSYIPISADAILTPTILHIEIRPSIERFSTPHSGHPIVQICSKSIPAQLVAIYDCFALGRSDARVFIALRYLTRALVDKPLCLAIRVLSHLTPHGDILWHKGNWVPAEVTKEVRPHFIWDTQEIYKFLSYVDMAEWQRGGSGEDLYVLFIEDPDIKEKMESVALTAMNRVDEEIAWIALYLTVYWAGTSGAEKYHRMLSEHPGFQTLPLAGELEQMLRESGYVILFE